LSARSIHSPAYRNAPVKTAIIALLTGVSLVSAEWNGSIAQSASASDQSGVKSTSLDQQYSLYTSAQPTAALRYSLGALFRHLQSNRNNGPYDWRTEVNPSASLHFATRAIELLGDGTWRTEKDEAGLVDLTSQDATVKTQTKLSRWPRWFASASWAKNVDDLDLIGYDISSRTLGTGVNYYSKLLSVTYDYADTRIRNDSQTLDRLSRNHSGRLDNSLSISDNLLSLQSSYQVTARSEEDLSTSSEPSLIYVTSQGLYLDDSSPEFDALDPAPALTDALLDIPASSDYNLVNGRSHNFGLDFGLSVSIDRLHLYLDSLSVGSPSWSLWKSDDNLNWTLVKQGIQAVFSPVFYRYEFAFDSITARYVKLALAPTLLPTPVEVTELRAFITSLPHLKDSATDHRGATRLLVHPASWLHGEIGGDILRQDLSQTALAREEDALHSSLRFVPASLFDLTTNYGWSRRHYNESGREEGTATTASAFLRSEWSRPVTTKASFEKREEKSGNIRARRSDATRVDLDLQLLPALRSTSQLTYSEDENFLSPDVIFTRSLAQAFGGEPNSRSQVSVNYRYDTHSARAAAVVKYRSSVNVRAIYRMTETITLSSFVLFSEDPNRSDQTYNGLVAWSPTYKLNMSGSMSRIESSRFRNESQYSAQVLFKWTLRTEISASYSLNEAAGGSSISSSRLSLVARF
jgi:hypothetical protein